MARMTKSELEELIKVKDDLINTLIKKNIELENKLSKVNDKIDDEFCNSSMYKQMQNEIEHLKTQINIRCNLGRKQKFSDDEKATIQLLRLAGNSYRAIAKQMGCSVGTIHKIIKEME